MKISIIGYGHVGKAMHKLFTNANIYDEPLNIGSVEEVDNADITFVCVPTPMKVDGSCDTSIVEEVISRFNSKLFILRSTVYVGFTDWIKEKSGKKVIFQPEYYGETVAHPFADLNNRNWLIFGGDKVDVNLAIKAYQNIYNSTVSIRISDSKTAELAKYMENSFLATKVTFCNEFFDIAKAFDVDYNVLRELWLDDPRINRSHTFVYEDNRGFGGKCLPKDINSIVKQSIDKELNVDLLESVINKNRLLKK